MATEKPAPEKRVYEFVDNLVRLGKAQLVERLAIEPPEAEEVMTAIAHAMILESARFHIYVPVAIELQLSPRNEAIWNEYSTPGPEGARPFSTARISQLARKHQLTERQIYKIIDVWRAREMAHKQPELPGFEGAES